MTVEHRVYGPPGCGKTRYLSEQAPRAAAKYGATGVAIVSLTKAAAQEIGDRVDGIPASNVGTLHAFAYRALGRPALADTPDGLQDWNRHVEGQAPGMRIGRLAGVDPENAPLEGAAPTTDGEKLMAEMGTLRARMRPVDTWPARVRRFRDQWEDFKEETGRRDFTDLVERLVHDDPRGDQEDWLDEDKTDSAGRAGEAPGSPAVLMIDEAQDLSRLEFTLLRRWAQRCEQLVVVGDPDQNLYEWRGSEPDAFVAHDAASETVLSQSFRVPRAVRDYALEWVERIPDRKPIAYEPRRVDPADAASDPAPGDVGWLDANWRRTGLLLRAIDADIQAGRTVMVLGSCAFMLDPLLRELRALGVPYHNPYRPKNGGWNPLRGGRRLLAFMRPDPAVHGDDARLWSWKDVLDWTEPLRSQGVLTRGAKTWLESKCASDRLGDSRADQEADLDVVLRGGSNGYGIFASEQARDAAYAMDVAWWRDNLRDKRAGALAYSVDVAARHGGRALAERPSVIVGTVHSVKGGEADSVYVFPDLSHQAYWWTWQVPSMRAPSIRLFYVAMTRARERLTVLEPAGGEYAQLPRPDTARTV